MRMNIKYFLDVDELHKLTMEILIKHFGFSREEAAQRIAEAALLRKLVRKYFRHIIRKRRENI